ncbi:MAG TPA: aminodeoxychorismate synthase component I [Solirubrobacteraceae bacterium]|nr:aminodeoxychorismate synthase component I [Solirubrobacteraceae bacterium]
MSPAPDCSPGAAMVRVALELDATPEQALLALRDDPRPFALVGDWAGGGALVGSEPLRVVTGAHAALAVLEQSRGVGGEGGEAVVGGGWFGWLGFAVGGAIERLTPGPPRPDPLPAASLAYYDHLLRRDPEGRWWFEALATPERREALEHRLGLLAERLRAPGRPRPWKLEGLAPRPPGYVGHRAAVAACLQRIAAGEIYQANLCLRFQGRLDGAAIDAFAAARARLRPAYAAFFDLPGGAVMSLSPELFLRRCGERVESRPVKGTAPRSEDPVRAAAQRDDLTVSAKDAAENVMITDLMRNDLGRVCRYGSIAARPPHVEAHPGVWHLVSTVEGELGEGVTDADLVRAAFPPGSVTGAPKVQALKVISALEATGRETYTGAVGYASAAAGLELNVAIRTFEVRGDRVWLGAGGGVVADSDPDAEVREAWRKAAPLVRALGAELPEPGPPAGGLSAGGLAPRVAGPRRATAARGSQLGLPWAGGPRPDSAQGLIETLAVRDGEPVDLEAHLARLTYSARTVLRAQPPAELDARVRRRAAEAPRSWARLRIVAVPGDEGLACDVPPVEPAEPGPGSPVALVPLLLPGGLGEHKWADRRLVDACSVRHRACPLLVDLDGGVLEAGWANVWLLEGRRLVTPPADGRLLPGVVRAAVPAVAGRAGLEAGEEAVSLERLEHAEAVLLTSSVRLVTVAALAGRQPSSRGALIADRLRAALRGQAGRP